MRGSFSSEHFLPFGPKGCVGKHLGMIEVQAALKVLVPTFTFSLSDGDSLLALDTQWDITN